MKKCNFIAEACTKIVKIILTCRLWENRFSTRFSDNTGDEETERAIVDAIPQVIACILDFSWYTDSSLKGSKFGMLSTSALVN